MYHPPILLQYYLHQTFLFDLFFDWRDDRHKYYTFAHLIFCNCMQNPAHDYRRLHKQRLVAIVR